MNAIARLPQIIPLIAIPQQANNLHRFVPTFDPILLQLQKENTCWQCFKAFFQKDSHLFKAILSLTNKTTYDSSDISKVASAFLSTDYYRLRSHIRTILIKLPSIQRSTLFNHLAGSQNLSALHNCLALIPREELMKDLKIATNNLEQTIKTMATCETIIRKKSTDDENMLRQPIYTYVTNIFHGLMDTLMMAFSFFEIGKEPSTSWDASYLLTTYGKILAAPLAIFTALTAIFPIVTAILYTMTAVLAIIIFIAAYAKWLKPCPENIELFQNLTTMAKEGRIDPVVGREDETERMIQCLASSSSSSRSHPILIGPPGVGKTELVKGLALRIVQGNVPECLKNKKIFMINTTKLVSIDRHDTVDRIQRLQLRLGKHKKDVIIFFDEVHAAFANETVKTKLGENLKTVLDTNPDGFPYCIAATTEDSFNKYILTDPAIDNRRLVRIDVKPTTEDKTMWIMREIVLRQAADLLINEKHLKMIYDHTKHKQLDQPAVAVRILSKVISNIRLEQSGYHALDELQGLKTQFASQMSAYRMQQDPKTLAKLMDLEQKIAPLETARANEKEQLKNLTNLQNHLAKQKESIFKLAYEIAHDHSQSEEYKKFILFMENCLKPNLENRIGNIATHLKHTPIDTLIKQEFSLPNLKRRKSFS